MSDIGIFTAVTTNTTAFWVWMQCDSYKFTHVWKNLLLPSRGWRQQFPPRRWYILIDNMVLSSRKRRFYKKKTVTRQARSRAIFQAVSHRPPIRKACLQYRVSSCVIYKSLSEFRIAFSPNSSVLPQHYHSTSVPHSYFFHAIPAQHQTIATDTAV